MAHDSALAASIGSMFRVFVLDQYVPRIRQCVELLEPEECWVKPGSHGNSVANLLLHLAGNVRQWVLVGLGGQADERDRDGEFAATASDATPQELVDRLESVVREAAAVIESLSADAMLANVEFQGGLWRETALYGVVHVIEHFSGHAGQIYAFTKQQKAVDLKFYDL